MLKFFSSLKGNITSMNARVIDGPSIDKYINASYAAYTGNAPDGFSIVGEHTNVSTGMHAIAFKDNLTNNIIIAYEGTNPKEALSDPRAFTGALNADKAIMTGDPLDANNNSVSFAEKIALENPGCKFYVTGHSLGGEEAQIVAQKCSFISGGATFGAPGVPGAAGNSTGHIVNYVNKGDPIGNYVPEGGAHIGHVQYIGTKLDAVETLKTGGGIETHLLNSYAKCFNVSLDDTPTENISLTDRVDTLAHDVLNEAVGRIKAFGQLGGSENKTNSTQAAFDIPNAIPKGSILDHAVVMASHAFPETHVLSDLHTIFSHVPLGITIKAGLTVGGIYKLYNGDIKSASHDFTELTLKNLSPLFGLMEKMTRPVRNEKQSTAPLPHSAKLHI